MTEVGILYDQAESEQEKMMCIEWMMSLALLSKRELCMTITIPVTNKERDVVLPSSYKK